LRVQGEERDAYSRETARRSERVADWKRRRLCGCSPPTARS
jgi:hypothetical protein